MDLTNGPLPPLTVNVIGGGRGGGSDIANVSKGTADVRLDCKVNVVIVLLVSFASQALPLLLGQHHSQGLSALLPHERSPGTGDVTN